MRRTLKEILYQYANTKGGGLPLTAEEVCNAVVQWVQQYVEEQITPNGEVYNTIRNDTLSAISSALPIQYTTSSDPAGLYSGNIQLAWTEFIDNLLVRLTANDLIEYFKGSETVIVDLDESGSKIEIHLDAEILSKIERAVLTPIQAPIEPKIPVLGVDNAIEWSPVSDFISSDSGSELYLWQYSGPTGSICLLMPFNYTSKEATIAYLYNKGIDNRSRYIPCNGRVYSQQAVGIYTDRSDVKVVKGVYSSGEYSLDDAGVLDLNIGGVTSIKL